MHIDRVIYFIVGIDEEAEDEDREIIIHSTGAGEGTENCSSDEGAWDDVFVHFANFQIFRF